MRIDGIGDSAGHGALHRAPPEPRGGVHLRVAAGQAAMAASTAAPRRSTIVSMSAAVAM
jgi:hypothetical protein